MRKILSFVAAMLFVFAANATETQVSPGSGALKAAVDAASAGDVLVLAEGTYSEPEVVELNKNLTIKAAEGAHPVVAQQYYMKLLNSAQVTFIGIKFDGGLYNEGQGANDHCIRAYDDTEGKTLTVDACEFCNWKSYILYPQRANRCAASFTIRNCYFHDNKRCAVFTENEAGALGALTIENSTFANFTEVVEALISVKNGGTETANQVVRVDHCTFYNFVKNSEGDYSFIDVRKSTDVHISNCIFAQPTAGMSKATYCYGGAIDTCLIYNTNGHRSGSCVVTGSIEADPLFVDAANGDYTLGEGSPALAAGTEGSNLGDPRWWPAAPVPPTPQPAEVSWDWSKASYSSASESSVVWSGDDVTLTLAKANSQTAANNYLGGTNGHTRVYASQTLTFAPAEGVTIESIEITATSNDYAGKFKNSTWTNASATTSGSIVTVTPTDGASAVVCTITAATRATEVKVTYVKGEAPAVAKPAIAGETSFFGETAVTITCDTEGAAIYYTLDGTEPTAASTQYTAAFNLTASATVKAIAILGDDASAVVEAQFTKNPSFASFEALIAAGVADKTLVEVSFADIVIDSIYVNSSNLRKGIYFTVGETAYEIYYSNGDVVIPEEWVAGGKVSGTIRGQWTVYKGLWELVPTAPWTWAALTYAAPTPVVPVQYCALASGHQNDPEFADPNGRILLTIKKGEGNNIIVAIKNNNEAGNTKTGLNYLWVNAQGATAVARYGDGTHDEADVEEVSVVVEFNEAKETYNFINIHWAYSGWTGEWAIDGLDVAASELCPGTDPVVGATNYYLVGTMNNWTPGLTDVFGQNPGAEGEYMAKATLAVGDEFKVMGITSGVLNPDTTWYPDLAPNYVVDVDHAGAAKNIYFRPDGQGGEGWHYGVIFVEPNQDALKAVSDSTTWNFSKLAMNTESPLYLGDKEDAIKLSSETAPSTADEIIYANYDSVHWTIAEGFDGEAIAFTGQYPIRKNQFCQNGVLRIKTTVAGNIYVKFSDTGSSASDNPTRRYLMVNGDSTEYWTSRPKKNDDDYESRLNVETGAIHVPAGDVTIKGSQAICVYYVTFVPDAAPIVNYYVAGSMNGWKADENYMLTPNNESLYEGEFTFAANDEFKVIGYDGSNTTWFPTGENNNFKITEAGDYKITFNPAGNVEGWYEGYFNVVKKETPAEGPTAPVAAPTWPANQVKAVYSATYNADCGFGEWGSGTAYTQDEYGKKYVTTGLGYFGLTFDGEGEHLNCSNMEKLHMDVWIAQDTTIRVVPIWTSEPGKEQGIFVRLEANKWNSVEIALADYDRITSWLDIYQIKIDEARNMTFWMNNIYFYTTVAPEKDSIAPTDVTAEVAETSFFSARIKVHAKDNSGVVKYDAIYEELAVASTTGASDEDAYITVKNLTPNTDYNFSIVAKDESGNMAEPIVVAVKTLPVPAPAPTPDFTGKEAVAVFCDALENNPAIAIGQWGQTTIVEPGELAQGDNVYYCSNMNYLGWEFTPHINATDMEYVHIDFFAPNMTSINVTPISPGKEGVYTVQLTQNEWTSVDVPLSAYANNGIDWSDIFQFKFMDATPAGRDVFIDNVYFFKETEEGIENLFVEGKAVKVLYNGQILILKNNKVYTVTGQPVNMK